MGGSIGQDAILMRRSPNGRLYRTGCAILMMKESEWEVLSDRIRDFAGEGVRMGDSIGQDKRF